MKLRCTDVERMAIERAMAKEEAELPFAVKGEHGLLFVETHHTKCGVSTSCGCGAEILLVSRNVVVVRRTRCRDHGDTVTEDTYAVLGHESGGFAHLRDEAKPLYEGGLHAPLEREEGELLH